jgi:hypothetical protein
MNHNVVLGIFNDKADAEAAITDFENDGYNPKEISILVKDGVVQQEIARTTGANVASGIAEGATTGGVVGGVLGLLVGLGAITIPGIGAFLIGGPIAAALGLGGAAAVTAEGVTTGAVAGGLLGALVGVGLPEETAKYYEENLREGAILLAVSPKDSFTEAQVRTIFNAHHAQQVHYVA